jgi:cysteine desulfurase
MSANNEIGTLSDMESIGELCRGRNILFHSDAAQATGKVPVDVRQIGVDLLSFTSHKMYGPKGIGALYIRKRMPRVSLAPQIDGGGHEHGLRSGTLNVPGIVGFGAAAQVALEHTEERSRILMLRTRFLESVYSGVDNVQLNGDPVRRLPGNINLRVQGVRAERMLTSLSEVAFSTGSACSSANPEPSHVLTAIGLTEAEARSSIRLGIGRFNTVEEIDYVSQRIVESIRQLRKQPLAREIRYS